MLEDFARSGLSRRQWCERRGVREFTLASWLRRQKREAAPGGGDHAHVLVALQVREEEVEPWRETLPGVRDLRRADAEGAGLVLECAGVRLRLIEVADTALTARLLHALCAARAGREALHPLTATAR